MEQDGTLTAQSVVSSIDGRLCPLDDDEAIRTLEEVMKIHMSPNAARNIALGGFVHASFTHSPSDFKTALL